MPSLNVVKYIEESLKSVINQKLTNIEIICVDAGSTDGTIDIIKKYSLKDSRIKLVHSERKSYGFQMNLGMSLAKGEYIGIVETDDFIDERMYNDLYNYTNNGEVDIVKGTFYHFYSETGENNLVIDWSKKELKDVKESFNIHEQERFLDGHPSIWAGIYRRELLLENNIKFVEEDGGGWVDNSFFFETACAAKNIIYRPQPYYYYRELNPDSSSNNLKDFTIPIRRMIENLGILEKYKIYDENVLHIAYIRVFAYLDNIYRRDNYEQYLDELIPFIHQMLKLLDEKIVLEKLNYHCQTEYFKYMAPYYTKKDKPLIISKNINDFLTECNNLDHLKKEKNNISDENKKLKEKIFNLKYELSKFDNGVMDENTKILILNNKLQKNKENGFSNFISNIKSHINEMKFRFNPIRKKNFNVLFIPSDNSRTSGAFLSMANLIVNLREKYGLNIFVILPNEGHGYEVLDSMNIDYCLIDSKDWVIPLSQEKDNAFKKEVYNKIQINNKAVNSIRQVIQEKNIDMVHINTTYSYVGAKAALHENVPFVWHLREFLEEDQENTLWDREEGNSLINTANKIVAISNSIQKKYENVFEKDKLVRIYNGIDAKKFYKPNHNILQSNKKIFIMVGGFEYYKGQIEFAKACSKLFLNGYKNFEVWFIGTGKDEVKQEVQDILTSAKMSNVKYLGYKKNVQDYYEKADISFTCAKSEAFGRTTVEAMLSGNLIIGADSAGTKELIEDGKTGLLYEHGNSDDLFNKMQWVLNNIDKSIQLSKKGREYMFNNMTAEKNADNVFKLYQRIFFENE